MHPLCCHAPPTPPAGFPLEPEEQGELYRAVAVVDAIRNRWIAPKGKR